MKNGTFLGRAQILEFRDREFAEVAVPEWGDGTVRVRRMNVGDRLAIAEGIRANESEIMIMARVVCYSLCDASGARVFKDEDLTEILGLDFDPVRRVYQVAMELSKVRAADADAAEKNSVASPSGSSVTA